MTPEHESEQDKILKVYLCGNLEKGIVAGSNGLFVNSNANDHAAESQIKRIIEIEEYLMNGLVFKRNMKMAGRIDDLLKTNKSLTFFFAIGTGKFFYFEIQDNMLLSHDFTKHLFIDVYFEVGDKSIFHTSA